MTTSLIVLEFGLLHLQLVRVLALVKPVTPVTTLTEGSHCIEDFTTRSSNPDVNPLPGLHVSELPRNTQLPQKLDGTLLTQEGTVRSASTVSFDPTGPVYS